MNSVTPDDLVDRVCHLHVYRNQKSADYSPASDGAPHKPLLLLVAIQRAVCGRPRMAAFDEYAEPLTSLLRRFAANHARQQRPEYPFVRLCHDGEGLLWSIHPRPTVEDSSDPTPAQLRQAGTQGGLTDRVYELLRENPELAAAVVRAVLRTYWESPEKRFAVAEATGLADLMFL